jgi:hypothetical protein
MIGLLGAILNALNTNLDAKVSSRASATSAPTWYTAPDNADVSSLRTDYTTTRAGNLDKLDANVSTRAQPSDVQTGANAPSADATGAGTLALTVGNKGDTPIATSSAADGTHSAMHYIKALWNLLRSVTFSNLDAAVSSRSTLTTSQVPDPAHYTAARGDKLDNLDATVSSRATQAQILSDATPFAGAKIANLDAAVSSRALGGSGSSRAIQATTPKTYAVYEVGAVSTSYVQVDPSTAQAIEIVGVAVLNETGGAGSYVNKIILATGASGSEVSIGEVPAVYAHESTTGTFSGSVTTMLPEGIAVASGTRLAVKSDSNYWVVAILYRK